MNWKFQTDKKSQKDVLAKKALRPVKVATQKANLRSYGTQRANQEEI